MSSNANNAQQLVRESSLTSCKRCGETELVWIQRTNGKWMLCPISRRKLWTSPDGDPRLPKGMVIAIKMRPHVCGEKQRKLDAQQAIAEEMKERHRLEHPFLILANAMSYLSKQGDVDAINVMRPIWQEMIEAL